MLAIRNILLPTDFSVHALHAMTYAIAVAKKYGSTLHLAHVVDASTYSLGGTNSNWLSDGDLQTLLSAMQEHAESQMGILVQKAKRAGVEQTQQHMARGKPVQEILRLADKLACDLIVLATHGRSGLDHVVLGSVCERVVRLAQVPVLSIKKREREFVSEDNTDIELHRILFPTDFSEFAEQALPNAVALCQEFGADLVLMHTNYVPPTLPELMPDLAVSAAASIEEYAKQSLESLRSHIQHVNVETRLHLGTPHREISRAVEEYNIDLVVMPTHGRSGVAHMLFGSVTEKVVRTAKCPVLTIRPRKVASKAVTAPTSIKK